MSSMGQLEHMDQAPYNKRANPKIIFIRRKPENEQKTT